ncbi:hypothetical protein D3C76_1718960 [compost metagenome]
MAIAFTFLVINRSTLSFWVGWEFWLSTISTLATFLAASEIAFRTPVMKVSSNL